MLSYDKRRFTEVKQKYSVLTFVKTKNCNNNFLILESILFFKIVELLENSQFFFFAIQQQQISFYFLDQNHSINLLLFDIVNRNFIES